MATQKQSANIQVVDGEAYAREMLQKIPQAKKRVVVATMVLLAGKQADDILAELKKAQQRGVRVRVLLDNFTRLTILTRSRSNKGIRRLKTTLAVLKDLSAAGARVYYAGKIGLIPYRGRCHIKATVIDDEVYSFGGPNLSYEDFTKGNYMLYTADREYADCLEELVKRVGTMAAPLENGAVDIDSHNTILFDGGKRHNSIIYDKACELTAQATKVHFVSQMVPSSKLAHLLHETNSTLYYNRPNQMIAPDSWGQAFDEQKYRLTNSYTGQQYIHAKFMLFELPGGRKVLLSGSNNFSYRGVAFGTQEIALYSTDEKLWQQLYAFLRAHVVQKK